VHKWAIRYVVGEAELPRSAFLKRESQVFQKGIDYLDAELACGNFQSSQDTAGEVRLSVSRRAMSVTCTRLKFELFRPLADEFYFDVCCHRIVVYGIALALVSLRITGAYSANACAASFGPEGCPDHGDDETWWANYLQPKSAPDHRFAHAAEGRDPAQSFPPALVEPFVVAGINKVSPVRELPRAGVITAGCALLAGSYDVECSPNFPAGRCVGLETQTVPGMISRVVRFVVKASSGNAAAGFCGHVDRRMRDALRVEFDSDVFDAVSIETLIGRFKRVVVAMTADSGQRS
jgi:hypothetical protein